MPSVLDLVNRVAMLGQNESNPDADLQARYLSMIQASHNALYGMVANDMPSRVETDETVVITSGTGMLSQTPFIISNVADSTGRRNLKPTDLRTLRKCYPTMAFSPIEGYPEWYYMSGTKTLNTFPSNSTIVDVLFIPEPMTLTLDTTEDQLFLPVVYHDLYVFFGMFDVAIDERDKGFGLEMQVYKARYDILYASFLVWLKSLQVRSELFTKPYLNG